MAGHHVYSCQETRRLADGMVIALDYLNLPRGDTRDARRDGKAVAARAVIWGRDWTKYLNYRRVQRWNNPIGFGPVPAAQRQINKTYIRNSHVVDMDEVYRKIWFLSERRRLRSHNGLPGRHIGAALFNWSQSTRRAQGAAGGAGQMTNAEINEVMHSPPVANYPYPAGQRSVTAQIMLTNFLLLYLPEFLCQLGAVTSQHDFV